MVEDEEFQFPWEIGLYDAHCHPTDTMSTISALSEMNATAFTIMSTRAQDQDLVAQVAGKYRSRPAGDDDTTSPSRRRRVIPSFGWHPWFSYQMYDDTGCTMPVTLDDQRKISHYQAVLTPQSEDRTFFANLPDPILLSKFLEETRQRLSEHPTALVGEVGLDKGFRLPQSWLPGEYETRDESLTPGGREGRRLSPYKVQMGHQRAILKAQLALAAEMDRAVSIHGVQAHGVLFDTISETWKGQERKIVSKRERRRRCSVKEAHSGEDMQDSTARGPSTTYPPRICLHSYSGPVDTLKQYMHPTVPVEIYVSFSIVINFSTTASTKTEDVIKSVPDDRVLIESDMHTAGETMDQNLKEIAQKICSLKGWELTAGLRQLSKNWRNFVFGSDEALN